MEKIKVFQFPFRDSNSGVANNSLNNWKHMDKSRFICHFGTVGTQNIALENKVLQAGADIRYISCYGETERERFIEEVSNLFQKERYDVVQLHTSFWKSFLVEEIARDCGIPKVIVHSRSTMVDIKDEVKRLEAERIHELRKQEFNTSLATDYWACSTPAADWLFGPQIPRDRIKIMKNAIDVRQFLFDPAIREKYRKDLGLEGCFVVGHVGRLSHQKNHEFLLNVFAPLAHQHSNMRLLLVGDGELGDRLRRQAAALEISQQVLFLGARSDVSAVMQAMDVFCLPSRFEGFGNVLVEAQSSGLRCIVSDVIPQETRITAKIEFLPFHEERWREAILDAANGYERGNMYDEITAAGYNIDEQIKVIEAGYRG